MYDVYKELIQSFRAAPDVLDGLLQGVTQEQAKEARGGDENWSVVEVMCHLRDAEERSIQRMRAMRDREYPRVEGYDQDAWAHERNYAADNLESAFAAFKRFRAQHIAELEALTPEQWERPGNHSEQGRITINAHTAHLASHDIVHAAQIARQLSVS